MANKEEKEEKKEEKKNGEEQKPKKSKKLLIIIILVLVIVAGGVTAFLVLGGKGNKAADEKPIVEEQVKNEILELDSFVVNLAKANNFLRTTLQVEYNPNPSAKSKEDAESLDDEEESGDEEDNGNEENVEEEGNNSEEEDEESIKLPQISVSEAFTKRDAMVRDAIISVLSSKAPDDILTQEGKIALKGELVSAINEALGLGTEPVVSVYFKEFIMQ